MREEALLLPYEAPLLRDDDHPLFEELCDASRKGDLAKVKRLVEVDEVPVNRRDKWDSTPLYYTALCGHIEVTQYLLHVGAHCDPNTFEGERCLYGALNDQIRNLLRSHRVTKAVDSSADYALFTYSMFTDPEQHQTDITFTLPNAFTIPTSAFPNSNSAIPSFDAHRSVLAARIPFLAYELASRWKSSKVIQVKNRRVHVATFRAVLLWAYSGQLARDVPETLIPDWLFLCRQWKLYELQSLIEKDQQTNAEKQSILKTVIAKRQVVLIRDVKGVQRDLTGLWRAVIEFGEDASTTLSPAIFLPVLEAADLLLLDRLKSQTVTQILSYPVLSLSNHADLLRASWSMNLPRLEQHLTRFYAETFDTHCQTQTFRTLIKDSSDSVVNRQETDTIIFVDDLRWWLGKLHGFEAGEDVGVVGRDGVLVAMVGERYEERLMEYERKVGILDGILSDLGIFVFDEEKVDLK
ncbi:hypothetical protein HDU76_013975 [Blyttiomyces sp. JEL0837]|nr:hypothetical protein HDU76_013975 [Blyttiomyces sp. JEL0837]